MVALSGPGWRLAPSLAALVAECDRIAPNRSTASDGSIGDAAHAARTSASDHNPSGGFVHAVDITDDKAGGLDADLLARHIVASRDPRVRYVIWNGTIAKSYSSGGVRAWEPQPYRGTNPHIHHTHVSIHATTAARNDTSAWFPVATPPKPKPPAALTSLEDSMLITRQDDASQALLFLGGKLFKGHDGAVKGNAATPKVAVNADVWGDIIRKFGPVID